MITTAQKSHFIGWLLRLVAFAPEPAEAQAELMRLTVRAGRRCAHDLAHAADDVRDAETATMWRERAQQWARIFYPAGGPKDYRDELHREIWQQQREVERLRTLCKANNIDPDSTGSATPF